MTVSQLQGALNLGNIATRADTPKLFFKKKMYVPLRSLLLREGHLRLTASQGSFPQNSFFAVETTRNGLLGEEETELVSSF